MKVNLYPKIQLAQAVIEIFSQKEIQHIVISPGSRNAPLTIGFTNQEGFTCYSIADERCAAFFALGLAQQLQKPVAVVCTSGSAVLNYYPAVAEAFYSQIPSPISILLFQLIDQKIRLILVTDKPFVKKMCLPIILFFRRI